jgi:hypothetical protein
MAFSSEPSSDAEIYSQQQLTLDFLVEIYKKRVLFPNTVHKLSQLDLVLGRYRLDDPKRFRRNMRCSPEVFDSLLELVRDDPIFQNNSNQPQLPVQYQLAIALFRFGHHGNAASVESIAQWAGVSAGTVFNTTFRIMQAFLVLHDQAVRWPNSMEKEAAKATVERLSCPAWRDGFCMVDGTLIPLFQKPGHHGEAYFDRKSNYSLNVQVCFLFSTYFYA